MRIAVVSDAVAPWHVGGKEARYQELIKRWENDGVEVETYTMKWWDGLAPRGFHGLMPKVALYTKDGQRSILQAALFSLACWRMLFVKTDLIEADHMPGPQLIVLSIVAKLKRRPIVATWHEYWGTQAWREYAGKFGIIGAWIERAGAKMVSSIIAVSEQTYARLLEAGIAPEKIHLVPNGTISEEESGSLENGGQLRHGIVTFGRLVPHKRVDVAIGALAVLIRGGVSTRLTVIGEGTEMVNLRALASELGVVEHVVFTGALEEQAEVWAAVAAAEVCLMPSEREGYGIAVAEALALGTPVVVSDAAENAARHLVEDKTTGIICSAGNIEAFAEAAVEAGSYDNTVVQQRFLENHGAGTWKAAARAQLNIYETILGTGVGGDKR